MEEGGGWQITRERNVEQGNKKKNNRLKGESAPLVINSNRIKIIDSLTLLSWGFELLNHR